MRPGFRRFSGVVAPDAVTTRDRGRQRDSGLRFPASMDLSGKCERKRIIWRKVSSPKVILTLKARGILVFGIICYRC